MRTHEVDQSDARRLIGMGWAIAIALVVLYPIVTPLLFALLYVGSMFVLIPAALIGVITATVMWLRGTSALLAARRSRAGSWTGVDTASLIMGILGAALGLGICGRIVLFLF